MAGELVERWVTVRIEDTADGLIIHPDDAREHGLDWDQVYKGYVMADGNMRVPIRRAAAIRNMGGEG